MKKALSIFEIHQRRIALDTLRMSEQGAIVAGGMDHRHAIQALKKFGHTEHYIRDKLVTAGHSSVDIDRYMRP